MPASRLAAVARPGRLILSAQLPGQDIVALHAAGRAALSGLRAALRQPRWRWAKPTDLAGQALLAARRHRLWRQSDRQVVSLLLANAVGDTAALSWWRDGEDEMLRWSCRGAVVEDGACLGPSAVAGALGR